MVISHKHKFIYLKATKVAGTSTEILLSDLCEDKAVVTPILKEDPNSHRARNYNEPGLRNHSGPKQAKKALGPTFNSYFKFLTARNPFDRTVSAFWWYLSRGHSATFKEFVIKKLGEPGLHLPLVNFASIDGTIIIDDFIRYESLEKDTLRIFNKWFKLDKISYPKAKSSQRKNKKHYSHYYCEETREVIFNRYLKDIEYFGYEFGE